MRNNIKANDIEKGIEAKCWRVVRQKDTGAQQEEAERQDHGSRND